ncbi:16S rRNA (guanine(527)-N(7))-methyltransferase RsmG [Porphyromonas uenonis]|uniref:16S rRNA (guanine(527)-N(7))-methyltransferase RsmG n=1 Tax=Porphyromonas uenonis TaxID=281920 RepID=UPI0026F2F381|nr:16S rRNA (guanine(527)-N(7))-methyltransferase RsmG [Porphyromonas uenonis]
MPITPSTTPTEQLDRLLRQFSALSPTATQQLTALYPLYREWNARINVISRRDIDNLYLHHVMHSLALAWLLPDDPTSFTVADVGCGGGFPSIPLAILFPQYQFLLIDSIAKKLHVAQSIADEIGLTNVSTHHTRVESCDLCCDYVVSRAAMPLELLHKYTQHMLHGSTAPRTGIYCLKGGDLSEEIAQAGVTAQLTAISTLADYPDYYQDKWIVYVAKQGKRTN